MTLTNINSWIEPMTYEEHRERNLEVINEYLREAYDRPHLPAVVEAFQRACSYGFFEHAESFLRDGVDVNSAKLGLTVLQYCVLHEDEEAVRFLISKKADVNKVGYNEVGYDDNPPLFLAINNNDLSIFKLLVESGADLSSIKEVEECSCNAITKKDNLDDFFEHNEVTVRYSVLSYANRYSEQIFNYLEGYLKAKEDKEALEAILKDQKTLDSNKKSKRL